MRLVEWNPILGCSPISPGCANCAAVAAAGADMTDRAGKAFNGMTRPDWPAFDFPAELAEPCAVLVCNHGDLFHASTPDHWIDGVFSIMEILPQHAFQVLSKRADRMAAYVLSRYGAGSAPPHIAFGVSAERQAELDQRIRYLFAIRAHVRYVTLYPLLERIDLAGRLGGISAVFAGAEPQRPADAAWFAFAERACAAHGVRFARSRLMTVADNGMEV